jgi:hypothetical protein
MNCVFFADYLTSGEGRRWRGSTWAAGPDSAAGSAGPARTPPPPPGTGATGVARTWTQPAVTCFLVIHVMYKTLLCVHIIFFTFI